MLRGRSVFRWLLPVLKTELSGRSLIDSGPNQSLERSEARHFEIYLDFAAREFDAAEIAARLEIIATREGELATGPDPELRFHSGPPG